MKRILALSLALLSFAADASAQKDLARERVSLLFQDTPLTQVFPALAKSLGYELSLDPKLRALVTLQVENVTAQTALTAICESVGCRWRQSARRLIVEARADIVTITRLNEKGEQFRQAGGNMMSFSVRTLDGRLPFDITWSPVDLNDAFVMLVRMMNAEVDLAPALRGRKIAVNIQNATMRQALDAICEVGSCRWELVEQPQRVVHVTDRGTQREAQRVYGKNEPGVKHPVVVAEVKPVYTREAMQAKIQGIVRLAAVVEPDGSVGDVQVLQSLDPGLDEQAIKALRGWRFIPGTKDDRPVPVRVEVEFTFTQR